MKQLTFEDHLIALWNIFTTIQLTGGSVVRYFVVSGGLSIRYDEQSVLDLYWLLCVVQYELCGAMTLQQAWACVLLHELQVCETVAK